MKDAVIIISGGMDSTTMLYEFKDEIALAITFDYGSTQNGRERICAITHCQRLGIKHIVVPLEFMHRYFKSALLMTAADIPDGNYDDENMKSTVVPFRNGIMLAVAAGIAESNGLKRVMIALARRRSQSMVRLWVWTIPRPIPATKAVRSTAANAAPAVNASRPSVMPASKTLPNMKTEIILLTPPS